MNDSRDERWQPADPGVDQGLAGGQPAVGLPGAEHGPYGPPRRDGRQTGRGARWLLLNVLIPLAILAAAVAVLLWLGEAQPAQLPPEDASVAGRLKRLPPAQVVTVASLDDYGGRLNLAVDGLVVPYREVQLASEVAGRIVFKDPVCEAGNMVEKGQLLFRIDPTDYRLEVERLTRLRDQEYQALQELDQETANAQRVLDVTTQELELRQRELERLRSLPGGFASQSELDQANQLRLQALQAKVAAENQRDLLIRRRSRLEAAERLAASQLEAAEVNLQRTEIRAPIAGVIVREDAELNSFIQRGSPIITIEDTSAAEVAVNLRMDQLYWVLDQLPRSPGDAARAVPGDYELPETPATIYYEVAGREGAEYQWQGKLVRYDGIGVDEQTRTVPVRIVVDDPKRVIRSAGQAGPIPGPSALVRGMFVRVVLHIEPRTSLMVIPAIALKPGNRIWQFQPDSDVLLAGAAADAGDAGTEASRGDDADHADDADDARSPAEGAPPQAEQPSFDPADWVPGRVTVLGNVRPIESLQYPPRGLTVSRSQGPAASTATAQAGAANDQDQQAGRYWVCEVPVQKLDAGDYAIVSPLASAGEGKADLARVPVEQIRPTDVPRPLSVAAR